MDFMFDWETEGDRFSFEDSERFEEDSLCSWISEPESVCNNWRGWKRQNGGQSAIPSQRQTEGKIGPLAELAAQAVACHIPFEVVEHYPQPIPEQLQLRIAFWSFPENEEDVRLYSCLANGSADEFQKGEHLYKMKAVKEPLQIGFHLSATVVLPQTLPTAKGSYNVAVVFDRRRITSCMCTCNNAAWCSHVVALCLYRIHQANSVCLRAPVSESLSRLHRDQLQKFAQYLISELPQQILPTAQKLLDELLSSQETAMNTVYGAPDPTAGPPASEQTSWCLDADTLHENIKKTLVKFCIPSPIVFSDVNYLSSTAPPAAAEWQSLLRPLRGREPEGMWNLLSIVREMFRRSDTNAVPLLEILTDEVLQCEQILIWWFTTKISTLHNTTTSHNNRGNSNSSANASQHAASSLCDEIVTLWRLSALNPKLSPLQREDMCAKFKEWHVTVIDKIRKARGSNMGSTGIKKSDIEAFVGFKSAIEAYSLDWVDYTIPGITYSEGAGTQYHISRMQDAETKKPSRVQSTVCSQDIISSDSSCPLPVMQFDQTAGGSHRGDSQYLFKTPGIPIPGSGLNFMDSGAMDPTLSSGSEGFCEPDKLDPTFKTLTSKKFSKRQDSLEDQDLEIENEKKSSTEKLVPDGLDSDGKAAAVLMGSPKMEPSLSESQPSSDEYQMYFYDTKATSRVSEMEKKKKDKLDEPNYFAGIKILSSKQDIWFARAEALHAHGHTKEACRLAQMLSEEIIANPPDLLAEATNMQTSKNKKKKIQNSVSVLASLTLAKAAFLCNVLSEDPSCYHLAFKIGMFGLEMPRPPASNKALEVKLAYQESELVTLLKRIPLEVAELNILREKAEQLKDGKLQSRGEALLPLTLASFMFDSLCLPATTPCGANSKLPSRAVHSSVRLPTDEKLGFEAAVAALGLKANVSEAEHPLLCEGTRRQRGDLAITMLVYYKDDQTKLSKIMDKLLDKEMHQMYKAPSLSTYLSNKSAVNHPTTAASGQSTESPASSKPAHNNNNSSSGQTKDSVSLLPVQTLNSNSIQRLDLPTSNEQQAKEAAAAAAWQDSPSQRLDYLNLEQGQASGTNHTAGARPKANMYSLKYSSGKDTDSSALEEDGDDLKALEARIRCMTLRKKPSQGMASIDSSAPETTSSDNSPTLVRRSWSKHQGPGSDSGSSGKSSDSLGSSSSDDKGAGSKIRDNESPPSPYVNRFICAHLMDSRSPTPNLKAARYKGKRIIPTAPNQPSEASAHFMFELAKTVLAKAGGNSSTSLFTQPSSNNNPSGPHRNLHLCAFQIGLYALGLHNCVSPNWLSRTYSSHVSWITGQAMEIGSSAINILIDTWEGHLTPPEVASLADRASRGRDPTMVKIASQLALSCLPHAHALNPTEVQRALLQCKEQSREMLEKACMAVESAAKGGGVYPEVLFEVARHWHKMYEEASQKSQTNNGLQNDISASYDVCRQPDDDAGVPVYLQESVGDQGNPSALSVIPFNQTPIHSPAQAPQIIPHSSNQPPPPVVIPYTIPTANPQLARPAYVPTYSFFGHQYQAHIPLHSNIHPAYITTYSYQSQAPFSNIQNMQNIQNAAHLFSNNTSHIRHIGPVQIYANPNCQIAPVQPLHGNTAPGNVHHLGEQNPTISPSVSNCQQQQQQQSQQPVIQNHTHTNYELAAYRVGMLAMETLARRVHDDRPQTKYARNPPYGEDVKWLFGVAIKLGNSYLQQFCASAVNAVVSPFILYDIAWDAAHYLARNNLTQVHNCLRSNFLNPLVQKCLQMFIQCAHQRIHHITSSEYDEFVGIICSAQKAFCMSPGGQLQFNDLLQSLRRTKSCRKELWQRIVNGLTTGNAGNI